MLPLFIGSFFVLFALKIFLSISISLFHFGLALFAHDVCQSGRFPFWIWQWEETLVPSQALD